MALAAAPTTPAAAKSVASSEPPRRSDVVVLDTSVLLADPESIFNLGAVDVVLPLKVIEELDNHKDRIDEVGRAARTVARTLEELRAASVERDLRNPVALPGGGSLRVVINGQRLEQVEHLGLDISKSDNRILAAALGLLETGRPVKVVSADVNLRVKAAALGLEAEEYVRTRSSSHTTAHPGWRPLAVSPSLIDTVFSAKQVPLSALQPADLEPALTLAANEFGVLGAGSQSALVRRVGEALRLVPSDLEAWELRPRSKEQRFALDLLLDVKVPIVALSGRAGTGKTMLAIAAGLEQVFEPRSRRYDRLMIIRPMYAVGRQEVGFLPGNLNDKIEPWFAAVEDTVAVLRDDQSHSAAREMIEMWAEHGEIDMQPVTYLRGRSLQRTYVVADEVQNLEPAVIKTMLTRLGEGSKIVLVGDVTQIDNPFVSERTSALSVLADRFAGQELFGHLVLTQGERSAVADLASELL